MSGVHADDRRWLDSAVRLARPHLGMTEGTPPNGALVVDETEHLVFGRGIGVAAALAEAAANAEGRTLYLTIEPPEEDCAAIVEAGIGRVVVGLHDPWLKGSSVMRLWGAEIVVDVAGHALSIDLNAAYAARVARNRPFATICLAISRDGMIGRRDETPVALMSDPARRWLAMQRSSADAVMLGVAPPDGFGFNGLESRPPLEIVVLGTRPPPPTSARRRRIVVVESGRALDPPPEGDIVRVEGRNARPDLRKAMAALAGRGINALHAEVGAKLAEGMIAAELVDRFQLVQTPAEIGRGGMPATALGGIEGRLRAAGFVEAGTSELGPDRLRTYERRP